VVELFEAARPKFMYIVSMGYVLVVLAAVHFKCVPSSPGPDFDQIIALTKAGVLKFPPFVPPAGAVAGAGAGGDGDGADGRCRCCSCCRWRAAQRAEHD